MGNGNLPVSVKPEISPLEAAKNRITKFMDASVDPCEDFANFVCGNFYEVYENDSSFHSFNLQEELIYKQGK